MKGSRALVEKYQQGKCTAEEMAFLKQWIQTGEAAELLEEMIEQQWASEETHQLGTPESQPLYRKIQKHLFPNRLRTLAPYRSYRAFAWKVAAALAFVVMATLLLIKPSEDQESLPMAESVTITKTTARGQKRTTMLPDGTKVVLNAESSLSYPEQFADSIRVVTLQGEGFFEVTKDSLRPFVVQTTTVETQVLGTSFNVRAYVEDTIAQVALVTGKVSVQSKDQKAVVLLTPGTMATYHRAQHTMDQTDDFPPTVTAWKDHILLFRHANYQTITTTLEQWYDVDFVNTADRQPDWQYNGEFEDKSLEYVLESISYACRFSYTIRDKKVIIKPLK